MTDTTSRRRNTRTLLQSLQILGIGLVLLAGGPAAAAPGEVWSRRYDGPPSSARDDAYRVLRDARGDVIVFGSTEDVNASADLITIKYSGTNHAILWLQRYDSADHQHETPVNAVLDEAGNVIVTGFISGTSGRRVAYTAKYAAANGSVLWERISGVAENSSETPHSVSVDAAGDIILAATSYLTNRFYLYLSKLAGSDGTPAWERRHELGAAANTSEVNAMALDSSGQILVTGRRNGDLYAGKFSNADGAAIWEKSVPARGGGTVLAVDANGNALVAGQTFATNSYDIYTAKFAAADGTMLWQKQYDGPENAGDYPTAIVIDPGGNAVVGGASGTNLYLAKLAAADGALVWEQRVPSGPNNFAEVRALAVGASGDLFVAGAVTNDYTARFSGTDGAILWEQRRVLDAQWRDVAVFGGNDPVVTGHAGGDIVVAEFSSVDGTPQWQVSYDGPAKGVDLSRVAKVDADGSVVVFGTSNGDLYTVKYARAGGALLWERRLPRPDFSWIHSGTIGLDPAGDVIVASQVQFENNGYSPAALYLAKYAGRTGEPLWEKQYAEELALEASVANMVVDPSGDFVFSGVLQDIRRGIDFYTAKFSGTDGSLLWERTFAGPAGLIDRPRAMDMDAAGNVIVTGSSINAALKTDSYTVKYAAADGALLWERWLTNGTVLFQLKAEASGIFASGQRGSDQVVLKLDAQTGAVIWEHSYTNGVSWPLLQVDATGALFVSSVIQTSAPPVFNPMSTSRSYVLMQKFTAQGALVWETQSDSITDYSAWDLYLTSTALDRFGNLLAAGVIDDSIDRPESSFVTKFDGNNGGILWEVRHPEFTPAHLTVDGQGGIAVTGAADVDYLTILLQDDLPPFLSAARSAPDRLTLTWPAPFTNWVLQTWSSADGLPAGAGATWTVVPAPAGTNAVVVPLNSSAPSVFFRLVRP